MVIGRFEFKGFLAAQSAHLQSADVQWFGSGDFLRAYSSSRILVEVFVSSKQIFRQLRILALLILGANGKGGYSGGYSGGALVALMSRCLSNCACRCIVIQLLGPPGPHKLTFDQVFASSRFLIFAPVRLQPEWIQTFASLWFSFHFWGGYYGGGGSFSITAFGRTLFLLAAGFVQSEIHMLSDKTLWTFLPEK